MIIDISRLLNSHTPTWPGDTPFSYELTWSQEETGSVNVGQFTTSCHTATHVDAPFHFKSDGMTIEKLPLEVFVGNALVIDVSTKGQITTDDFKGLNLSNIRRVLLKTETWTGNEFPTQIPVIDPELGSFFLKNGIELLGVDLPSVDPLDSKTLDTHHALLKNGVHILEGLRLSDVDPGIYRLTALPLNIEGADGSPVRAILETLD
ncbi:arylformamidase [Tenuibacillus multivorans]|uniref:Kynurenine formamidase n=1 Tax=Tenuibacillus multivorans TaxID=237069 RepID=A0A1G9WTA6_9BACI|nr:arylformamidase [Tenuibacillus multivorans]GEL77946.1 kynurenine formamidase [Tenuibacillus multivorans]SDM87353.1 arylformamidase [Tenuibacillus multivorans]